MPDQRAGAGQAAGLLLGELEALAEQVGSAEGLAALVGPTSLPALGGVTSAAALRDFLAEYRRRILIPLELPVIQRAYWHTHRYEMRELIVLDQGVGRELLLHDFSAVSRRVGWGQLRRLRPLRDHRLVQRYLAAVERGQAPGWHTVVYGLVLAVYGVPLRQGLLNYGHQTVRGFIHAAAGSLALSQAQGEELLSALSAGLPAAVEQVLQAQGTARLAVLG
jgi:urease accessory protein UreF